MRRRAAWARRPCNWRRRQARKSSPLRALGKWDVLKSQGIQHVLNSRTLDLAGEILRITGGEGVDLVLNSLTGDSIAKSFDVLKPGGRFVEIGKLGIWTPEQVAVVRSDVAYFTFDVDQVIDRDPALVHSTLGQVREWFEQGRLQQLARFLALPETTHEDVFYRAWTRKEAAGKALGVGISVSAFDLSDASARTLCDVDVGNGYAAAVAVRAPGIRLRLWDWRHAESI